MICYIFAGKQNITMKKNWMYGSVMAALFALAASGCADSQRTVEFRGIHDTLYRKSHRACRGNAPLSCLCKTALPLKSPTGAFIATQTRSCRKVQNGEDLFPMKIFTAPQHTRFVLPPFHPTKFFACLAGWYFSFGKLHLEFFISRLNEILRHDLTLSVGEPDNAAAKQG